MGQLLKGGVVPRLSPERDLFPVFDPIFGRHRKVIALVLALVNPLGKTSLAEQIEEQRFERGVGPLALGSEELPPGDELRGAQPGGVVGLCWHGQPP